LQAIEALFTKGVVIAGIRLRIADKAVQAGKSVLTQRFKLLLSSRII
jgi:hypothetical protein